MVHLFPSSPPAALLSVWFHLFFLKAANPSMACLIILALNALKHTSYCNDCVLQLQYLQTNIILML